MPPAALQASSSKRASGGVSPPWAGGDGGEDFGQRQAQTEAMLVAAFGSADLRGDGLLEPTVLGRVLAERGLAVTPQEVASIAGGLARVDGRVDYHLFAAEVSVSVRGSGCGL